MSLTVTNSWEFTLGGRRNTVVFKHNKLSGKQLLTLNGDVLVKTGAKYKLAGRVPFEVASTPAYVSISCRDLGPLEYSLFVGGKPVYSDDSERIVSIWKFTMGSSPHKVEFEHDTFDVYVDTIKVDTAGDFAEVGSVYTFSMADGSDAKISVLPLEKSKGPYVEARLEIAGQEIPGIPPSGSPAGGSGSGCGEDSPFSFAK